MTTADAMANGDKFLTLPGGYLIWNSSWSAADRVKNVDDTIKDFLANEMMLSR
jgi:hypothetical protein